MTVLQVQSTTFRSHHLLRTDGCSDCAHGTITITAGSSAAAVTSATTNPNGIHCSNICCKGLNGNAACCACKLQTSQTAWPSYASRIVPDPDHTCTQLFMLLRTPHQPSLTTLAAAWSHPFGAMRMADSTATSTTERLRRAAQRARHSRACPTHWRLHLVAGEWRLPLVRYSSARVRVQALERSRSSACEPVAAVVIA